MNRFTLGLGELGIVLAAWLLLAAAGFAVLFRYGATPGDAPAEVVQRPEAPELRWSTTGTTLVMFVHPLCGCTRASIHNLASILADSETVPTVNVVFTAPRKEFAAWSDTPLVRLAAELPGVHLVWDLDGKLTEKFHAQTSGWTMLFDEQGKTLFQGGITDSRGQEGCNTGSMLLHDRLANVSCKSAAYPVFGCPISGRVENTQLGGVSR